MNCPRCQGLMIEELVVDFADVEAVVQEHCLLCGNIQYPQACCDTTHELREARPVVNMNERACEWCGKVFPVKFPSDLRQNCSRRCANKSVGRWNTGRPRFMGAVPQ